MLVIPALPLSHRTGSSRESIQEVGYVAALYCSAGSITILGFKPQPAILGLSHS